MSELYTNSSQQLQKIIAPKIKCSSLPPAMVGLDADGNKLNRSHSNAGIKSQDPFIKSVEEEIFECKKAENSFFGRIFPRRSGKKKKINNGKREENIVIGTSTNISSKQENSYSNTNINYEPFDKNMITIDSNMAIRPNALRSGPETRQCMQPINIPSVLDTDIEKFNNLQSNLSIQFEAECKNTLHISDSSHMYSIQSSQMEVKSILNSSKTPESVWNEREQSSKLYSSQCCESGADDYKVEVQSSDLPSFQHGQFSLNDDVDNTFKSLTNLPTNCEKPIHPVIKYHSFKIKYDKGDNYLGTKTKNIETKHHCDSEDAFNKSTTLDLDHVRQNTVENINDIKIVAPMTEKNEVCLCEKIPQNSQCHKDAVIIFSSSPRAVINICSSQSQTVLPEKQSENNEENQKILVTNIHVKPENNPIIAEKYVIPQICNVVQKKIEKCSAKIKTIKGGSMDIIEDKDHLGSTVRKFSNDTIEFVKTEDITLAIKPNLTITPMANSNNRHYKKHSESVRRISPEKSVILLKSNNFELTESNKLDGSLIKFVQNINEKIDSLPENAMTRRKSLIKQKPEEEPELMKVFARRSLKLKDVDSEILSQQVIVKIKENDKKSISQDSDKENVSDSSLLEDWKKTVIKESQKQKDVFGETKNIEFPEVILQKAPINNKVGVYHRSVSLNTTKTDSNMIKQITQMEKQKTTRSDSWCLNKSTDINRDAIECDEISVNEKADDFSTKRRKFNQRKAEWEKRAQEAMRNT